MDQVVVHISGRRKMVGIVAVFLILFSGMVGFVLFSLAIGASCHSGVLFCDYVDFIFLTIPLILTTVVFFILKKTWSTVFAFWASAVILVVMVYQLFAPNSFPLKFFP